MLENVSIGISPLSGNVYIYRFSKNDKDKQTKVALEKRELSNEEVAGFLYQFFTENKGITFNNGDRIEFIKKEVDSEKQGTGA